MSNPNIEATYDPQDDKIRLRSLARLPADVYKRVKDAGFGWAPKQDCFYAVWSPGREDLAIELAGDIDEESTTREERAEARAERFEGYRDKRASDAESAHKEVSAIADNIPLGQPVIVGHHSQRHAERDAARIENGMRKAVHAWKTSEYWKGRATACKAHAQYLELPAVRARRIKKLESELRGFKRDTAKAEASLKLWAIEPLTMKRALAITGDNYYSAYFPLAEYPRQPPASMYEGQISLWSALDGGIITPEKAREMAVGLNQHGNAFRARWIEHLTNRLVYEREMLADTGGLKADKFDLQIGGQVQRRGQWFVVTKVNRASGAIRSVTVLGHFAATIQVEDITDYRPPAEGVTEKVKAATKLPPMCNYPGEGFRHMTTAEWLAKRMSDVRQSETHKADDKHGAHRTRTTFAGGFRRASVYLTDAKRVDPPAPSAPIQAPTIEVLPPDPTKPRPTKEPDPQAKKFEVLEQAVKQGVQVVTAPDLFPTPPALAAKMVELADIPRGGSVLEPSAGTGNILRAIRGKCGWSCILTAVEIIDRLCDFLRAREEGAEIRQADLIRQEDFLECTVEDIGTFDRVIMNPPFSNGADIKHILHARNFLNSSGRLVAICAGGPRQERELRPLATTWEPLPDGTFADQGTQVRTVLLTIEK